MASYLYIYQDLLAQANRHVTGGGRLSIMAIVRGTAGPANEPPPIENDDLTIACELQGGMVAEFHLSDDKLRQFVAEIECYLADRKQRASLTTTPPP